MYIALPKITNKGRGTEHPHRGDVGMPWLLNLRFYIISLHGAFRIWGHWMLCCASSSRVEDVTYNFPASSFPRLGKSYGHF